VTRVEGATAWIEQPAAAGEPACTSRVSLLGVGGIVAGDYIYHHAGLALARIDPEEAALVLAALDELAALLETR
jgi:hydrogenase maturation factor